MLIIYRERLTLSFQIGVVLVKHYIPVRLYFVILDLARIMTVEYYFAEGFKLEYTCGRPCVIFMAEPVKWSSRKLHLLTCPKITSKHTQISQNRAFTMPATDPKPS
ncbi:hypothetical protein QVD17_36140 [Tagetes erecta]|uniref:Uncharacterized protein n=1 Tax=Tagetes erecta TaxID=13708 RepID=A0AAD8JTI8_TARER|nr:hypothetical protein QVD17_36140 [Tagetes erecta]